MQDAPIAYPVQLDKSRTTSTGESGIGWMAGTGSEAERQLFPGV